MTRRFLVAATLFIAWAWVTLPTLGQQDKGKDKKTPPKVIMTLPLGAVPGQTVKFTVRGLNLDKATEIRFTSESIKAKILSTGKADVPEKNPQQSGDTQLVVEVVIPKDLAEPELTFEVETPEGTTKPHKIPVESKLPVVSQKEPNDGFTTAQKVPVPVLIDGLIDRAGDVDVYAIEGKAGQKLVMEVFAQRYGSLLDSMLTLYDQNGQQVAFGDYVPDSLDARLQVTLPRDGTYYLTVIDAHDRGGATYPYRLAIQPGK
jgi:hypothetical protein